MWESSNKQAQLASNLSANSCLLLISLSDTFNKALGPETVNEWARGRSMRELLDYGSYKECDELKARMAVPN